MTAPLPGNGASPVATASLSQAELATRFKAKMFDVMMCVHRVTDYARLASEMIALDVVDNELLCVQTLCTDAREILHCLSREQMLDDDSEDIDTPLVGDVDDLLHSLDLGAAKGGEA